MTIFFSEARDTVSFRDFHNLNCAFKTRSVCVCVNVCAHAHVCVEREAEWSPRGEERRREDTKEQGRVKTESADFSGLSL